MWSDATTRLMARFARAGSVMESRTIRAGIPMTTTNIVINVGVMSNSKMPPPRIWSMAPGW